MTIHFFITVCVVVGTSEIEVDLKNSKDNFVPTWWSFKLIKATDDNALELTRFTGEGFNILG